MSTTTGSSTVDRVQDVVKRDMLRGDIQPGTWLRQDELAERLGVSKIPVREALQRLTALGLLRTESNRGVVVPTLSADDAEEIFALRSAIEPQLLRRAIPNITIVDLAKAELAIQAGEVPSTQANWDFHRALYQPSSWLRGLAIDEILHASVAPYVLLYIQDLGGATNSQQQHEAILASCRAGDVDAGCTHLVAHLDEAAASLVGALQR